MEEVRPGWAVAAGAGLFLLAVLMGRLLVAGGAGWAVFAFAAPALLVALAVRIRFLPALAVVAGFCLLALAFRWLLLGGVGWPALLLLPVVAVPAFVAGKVLAALRRDRKAKAALPAETVREG